VWSLAWLEKPDYRVLSDRDMLETPRRAFLETLESLQQEKQSSRDE